MNSDHDTEDLMAHVLVPVSQVEDAHRTAEALIPYDPGHVTVTHVVEKGGGTMDKTSVAHSEQLAEECYEAVRETFPDADVHTLYETDVFDGICQAAREVDATAIVYLPRRGGRLARFLSGDLSLKLVTESPIPVVALPQVDDVDEAGGDERPARDVE